MSNNIGAIKTPSLIFSAEEEEIVDPDAHIEFIEKAKTFNVPIEGYFVKNAKHEFFLEKDRIRSNVLSSILDFYKEHP